MSESTPLISVCIPTFNGAQYLKEALSSVLSQTYPNIEIIVSDDGSDDATIDVVNAFKESSHIPVFVHQGEHKGIGGNWNNCVRKSHGEYIKLLMQDDILYPHCIAILYEAICKSDDALFAFSARDIIASDEGSFFEWWRRDHEDLQRGHDLPIVNGLLDGQKFLYSQSFLETPINKIGEPTVVLFHRSLLNKAGFFNENLSQGLDFEYWYRCLKFGNAAFVEQPLAAFRIHKTQASAVNKEDRFKKMREKRRVLLMLLYHLHRFLHPSVKREMILRLVRAWRRGIGMRS